MVDDVKDCKRRLTALVEKEAPVPHGRVVCRTAGA
jgi:hypothetical protein